MKKKKTELTFSSLVLMVLVIFVHVASECFSGYAKDTPWYVGILILHRLSHFPVQGFIFLSGLKLFLRRDKDFHLGKFWLGRLNRVVLPYVIAFAIFYVYYIIKGTVTPSVSRIFSDFFKGTLVTHFYFVVIICQFYLLMPLWRLIEKKASPVLSLLVSLILMLILRVYLPEITKVLFGKEISFNSHLFTTYLFYFVAGIFAGTYYDRFTQFLHQRRRGLIALWAVVGVVDVFGFWVIDTGRAWLSWLDMFHVLYCIAAILALMSISLIYAERERKTDRALMLVDKASYNVYLIHPLFIFIADSLLNKMSVTSLTLRFLFRLVFTFVLAIGVCVALEQVKTAVGRKKKKE